MSGASTSPTSPLLKRLQASDTLQRVGRLTAINGTVLRATGLKVRIGDICHLSDPASQVTIRAEVVGLSGKETLLSPLDPLMGLSVNASVQVAGDAASIACCDSLVGRVLGASGAPIDSLGPLTGPITKRPLIDAPPSPLDRPSITRPITTGVRVIDSLLTTGEGQRMGIFAAAGVGKTTLLGMLARQSNADVVVIGLIGERGRELNDMLEDVLGEDGLKRSVVVVTTSDQPAMERVRAAHTATAIAEHFRDNGKRVLLLMDSVTRFARALREIGLASGEAPARRGYPASVFAELPRLLERAGTNLNGSITAFYTVLVEDETEDDPIAEEVQSILDGHIMMRRALAERGQFPAIDALKSASRLFPRLADEAHAAASAQARNWLAQAEEMTFLIKIGEYTPGTSAETDLALEKSAELTKWFSQSTEDRAPFDKTLSTFQEICQ